MTTMNGKQYHDGIKSCAHCGGNCDPKGWSDDNNNPYTDIDAEHWSDGWEDAFQTKIFTGDTTND